MELTPLHSRLETAAGDRSYRRLGELTSTHPETVRRYMLGHTPSVEFLTGFCSTLGINATWLLTGQGPMLAADVKGHVLKSAGATDLLAAMADQLESMRSRLERIEVYVQTLETRLRVAGAAVEAKPVHPPSPVSNHTLHHDGGSDHGAPTQPTADPGARHPADDPAPADRIADAIAQRPPPPPH